MPFLFDWQKIHIKKESFKTIDIAQNKVLIQQLFKWHLSGSNAIPLKNNRTKSEEEASFPRIESACCLNSTQGTASSRLKRSHRRRLRQGLSSLNDSGLLLLERTSLNWRLGLTFLNKLNNFVNRHNILKRNKIKFDIPFIILFVEPFKHLKFCSILPFSLPLSLIRGTLNLEDSIIKFHVCVVIWAI